MEWVRLHHRVPLPGEKEETVEEGLLGVGEGGPGTAVRRGH